MNFNELKEKARQGIEIVEPDFISDNPDALNVGALELNPNQRLVFSISTFRNKKYFDIRTWLQAESGDWTPTKKGVHLPFDRFAEFQKYVAIFGQCIELDGSGE